jgi:hypothetical protein
LVNQVGEDRVRNHAVLFDNAVNIILQEYFSINKIFLKEIFNNLVKKFGWPDILKNDASFWAQEVMLVTF